MGHGEDEGGLGRRGFFKAAIGTLAALNGLVLGVPMIGSLLGGRQEAGTGWTRVAEVSSIAAGSPVPLKVALRSRDAYVNETVLQTVWVTRAEDDAFTVLSPVCTHLGCVYTYNAESRRFVCPCHGSVFALDGSVEVGPAPRALDTLPHKVEGGVLYIQWVRYRMGTTEKVEA